MVPVAVPDASANNKILPTDPVPVPCGLVMVIFVAAILVSDPLPPVIFIAPAVPEVAPPEDIVTVPPFPEVDPPGPDKSCAAPPLPVVDGVPP